MMIKKLISTMLAAILLTGGAYAAGPLITVTDITPQMPIAHDGTLPTDGNHTGFIPTDVKIKTENGVGLLVKTYELPPDADPNALVEKSPVRDGVEYTLREVLKDTLPPVIVSRGAQDTVSVSAPSDELEDILPLLPDSLEYDTNGYVGTLYLDESSITTEVESTRSYTYTVRETKEYHGLARNDPYLVPKTLEKNGRAYQLTDIKWSGGDENSASSVYTATAVYTGKATGQEPDGYLVTAVYAGEVYTETPGNVMYSVIYESIPEPEIIPDDFDWRIVARVALIVLGAGGVGVAAVFLIRRLRIKKRKVYHPDYDPEPRPARRKPHALGYMKRDGGIENA